ncbi:MAG: CDP-alcohol phosphatidyltransferase family protein [bacterium]|nr:CDP-alcohol phosphatidyltransferase family protein [bacterium]
MYFAIVTACTCFNMFLGLLAFYLAASGCPFWACWALLASVCFDACDGFLARKWGVASEFGAQMDSLADFASFCLAGGSLAYAWSAACASPSYSLANIASNYSSGLAGAIEALIQGGWRAGGGFAPLTGGQHIVMLLVAFCYICLGGMRLARYNATTDSVCPPSFFQGLPTTGAAAIMAALCLSNFMSPVGWPGFSIYGIAFLTVLFALLMVSSLPYPKLTKMTWVPKWLWALPVVVALFSLPGSAYFFCGLYLVSGPIYYFINKNK